MSKTSCSRHRVQYALLSARRRWARVAVRPYHRSALASPDILTTRMPASYLERVSRRSKLFVLTSTPPIALAADSKPSRSNRIHYGASAVPSRQYKLPKTSFLRRSPCDPRLIRELCHIASGNVLDQPSAGSALKDLIAYPLKAVTLPTYS